MLKKTLKKTFHRSMKHLNHLTLKKVYENDFPPDPELALFGRSETALASTDEQL